MLRYIKACLLYTSQLTGEDSTSEEQLKLQREQIDMKMEGLNLLASQEGKVLSDTEGAVSYTHLNYLLENSLIIMYNKTKKLDGRYVI